MKLPEIRTVGGLSCEEVLERLSDYVDDELSPDERASVDTHLAGCDVCERFGGRFASIVRGLKKAVESDS